MVELSVLVILIILVGIGLFIIISKVASTPDPEEDDLDTDEDDVFEFPKSVEEEADPPSESDREDTSATDHAFEDTANRRPRLQAFKERMSISSLASVLSGVKSNIISGRRYLTRGGRMFGKYVKQTIHGLKNWVSGTFIPEKGEQDTSQVSEEDNAPETTSDSPHPASETQDLDTQFLEQPTEKERSFSTFETDLDSEQNQSPSSASDSRLAHSSSSHIEEEKVDTFVQSMLEAEESEAYMRGGAVSEENGTPSQEQPSEERPAQAKEDPPRKNPTSRTGTSNRPPVSKQTPPSSPSDRQLSETDHLKKLEQKYLQMIVEDPKNIDSYRRLGNLYLAMEQYQDARETFRHILRLHKDDTRAHDKLREIERILKQNNNV